MEARLLVAYDRIGDILYLGTVSPYPEQESEEEYRKNKAPFHASPPASVSPSLARVPWSSPQPPSPPAAGERGRRAGPPPAARHPLRAPGRRRRPGALGLHTSGTGGQGTVTTLWHPRRRFNVEG
jgi:hypothetical protein